MLIQVNTDKSIKGGETLVAEVQAVVTQALANLSERITRVDVHLTDEDGAKRGPDDHRCMMEAHVSGRPSAVVTHHAANVQAAVDGASDKLLHALEHALGKLEDQRNSRESVRHQS